MYAARAFRNRPAFDVSRSVATGRRQAGVRHCHRARVLPSHCQSALSLSLYVLPRFLGEVVPARALSPGSGGVVGHARDPHSALELAGAWLGLGLGVGVGLGVGLELGFDLTLTRLLGQG